MGSENIKFTDLTPMTEERKGQIAYLYLVRKLRQDGIRLSENTKREIHATAKELGLSIREATEFAEVMVKEVMKVAFPKSPK